MTLQFGICFSPLTTTMVSSKLVLYWTRALWCVQETLLSIFAQVSQSSRGSNRICFSDCCWQSFGIWWMAAINVAACLVSG